MVKVASHLFELTFSQSLLLALLDLVGNIGVKLVMHLYQRAHVVSINLKAFLFQVGCSRKSSGDIGLDSIDLQTEESGVI